MNNLVSNLELSLIVIAGNISMNLIKKQENAVYYLKDNFTKEVIYGGAAR